MQPLTAPEAAQAADDDALKAVEGDAAVEARADASEQQEDTGENKAAMAKEATDKAHYPDYDASLAKTITDYILDNQDDAAQEERWRTTMKRESRLWSAFASNVRRATNSANKCRRSWRGGGRGAEGRDGDAGLLHSSG